MTSRRGPDPELQPATALDDNARSLAPVYAAATTVSDEQFEKIREGFDQRARDRYTPDDIFGYRLICSGNGVDSYFTAPDEETSLKNYVRDLQHGQSVLGNHAIGTFSYGSSYDGVIEDADPMRAEYEATFYRRYAEKYPEFATTRWVIGDYYMVRGVELNGEHTDSLIRAIEMGAIRKASISFTVGRYSCSVDGTDYIDMGWFGVWPDEDEGCNHFPGVEYKDGKGGSLMAYARMHDADLLETSWVYKNASPSAMLLRRANALAKAGHLDARSVASIEERYRVRLPAFDSGDLVPDGLADDAADPAVEPADPPADPPADDTVEAPEAPERTARLALLESRDARLQEVAGEEVTPEFMRSLIERAATGDRLFDKKVEEATQFKIRALGAESFDAERYSTHLRAGRDIDYVEDEIATYKALAAQKLSGGRSVVPGDVPRDPDQPKKRERSKAASSQKPGALLDGVGGRRTTAVEE
jgi:hypothetical protein